MIHQNEKMIIHNYEEIYNKMLDLLQQRQQEVVQIVGNDFAKNSDYLTSIGFIKHFNCMLLTTTPSVCCYCYCTI
jgi:hypothetical protein